MSTNVGSIHYDLGLDTSKFDRAAKGVGGKLEDIGHKMTHLGKRALQVGTALAVTGFALSTKAAFNQVKAVEEASFALKAYEKDGKKVNKVLEDLVGFAQSDTGVLFQREDLFAAAQTLKLYGQETDTLADKVKILSRGVSLGKTTFQELSNIIGRAAAKGRLDAVDFDMLIERGIGLDKSFRGATVTSEELFEALEKALPAELLEGRAQTIEGRMVRLKSAFRSLGSQILGVDKQTSKFVKGGLGDQFLIFLGNLRETMASERMQNAAARLGDSLAALGGSANKIIEAFNKGGFKAAMDTFKNEFANLDLSGKINEAIAKIDFPQLASRVITGIGDALEQVNWESMSGTLTTVFVQMFGNINWEKITFTVARNVGNIIDGVLIGFITGIFQWIKEDPMQFALTIASLLFAPAKFVGAISNALGKIPFAGTFFNFIFHAIAVLPQKLGAPIRGALGNVGSKMMTSIEEGITLNWYRVGYWFQGLENRVLGAIGPAGRWLWNKGAEILSGLHGGLSSAWGGVYGWLSTIGSKIKSAVGSLFGILWDAGWHAMNSLWSGLKSAWGSVSKWLGGIAGKIKSIKGPIDKDKQMLVDEGYAVMFGFNKGLIDGFSEVRKTLNNITASVSSPNVGATTNTSNTNFHAPIIINNKADAQSLLRRLGIEDEIYQQGLIPGS